MKTSYSELPQGYKEIFSVNLQKDKKRALWINISALAIAALMVIPAAICIPLSTLFDLSEDLILHFIKLAALAVGSIAYIILHELVHGITMKLFGTKKIKYGFTGLYAFAGSDDYYAKLPYTVIALAPVIFWGLVLLVLNFIVPQDWFWVVYIIQISNISGAAGDLYVTAKFSKMPSDILVKDSGVGMTVYSAK